MIDATGLAESPVPRGTKVDVIAAGVLIENEDESHFHWGAHHCTVTAYRPSKPRALTIRERLSATYDSLVLIDPPGTFDALIIGVVQRPDSEQFAVIYDTQEIIETLMADGNSSREEAEEWFDFNILPLTGLPAGPLFMERP
jgi:hypothetical protein